MSRCVTVRKMSCNLFQYCKNSAQFCLQIARTAQRQFSVSVSCTSNPNCIEFYLLGFLCSAYIDAAVIGDQPHRYNCIFTWRIQAIMFHSIDGLIMVLTCTTFYRLSYGCAEYYVALLGKRVTNY